MAHKKKCVRPCHFQGVVAAQMLFLKTQIMKGRRGIILQLRPLHNKNIDAYSSRVFPASKCTVAASAQSTAGICDVFNVAMRLYRTGVSNSF